MRDGQPLKERRRAEKAELFQKGSDRTDFHAGKEMLSEEGRLGFFFLAHIGVNVYCSGLSL